MYESAVSRREDHQFRRQDKLPQFLLLGKTVFIE